MKNQSIGKFVQPKENYFLSLIPENQPVFFTKEPYVYTNRF